MILGANLFSNQVFSEVGIFAPAPPILGWREICSSGVWVLTAIQVSPWMLQDEDIPVWNIIPSDKQTITEC
jgi:hypothetical protein